LRSVKGGPILTIVYIAFAVLGSGYVAISAVLGHLADTGDAGHGHDGGAGQGHDMAYGIGQTGHGSASAGSSGPAVFHFPFFSPLAVATVFGAMGAYGLVAQFGFDASDKVSVLVAVPCAVATTYAVTYLSWRLISSSTGSSAIRPSDLAGASAEVTTPIPAGGVGEVAAMVGGQRFSGAAREAQGRAVPRGAHVKVQQLVGSTMVVAWTESKES